MQQDQTKRIVIFVVSMALCFAVWYGLKYWLYPPPPPAAPVEARLAAALLAQSDGGLGQGIAQTAVRWSAEAKHSEESKPEEKPDQAPPPPVIVEKPLPKPEQYKHLGDIARDSKFHLFVELTPRGGAVLRVVLNKFQEADELGRPVKSSNGAPEPYTIVPEDPNNPSNQILHFDVNKKDDDKPYETLGKVDWTGDPDSKMEPSVVETTLDDGRKVQSVTLWSPDVQGFKIAKTYSLAEGDYHLGLEVKVRRVADAAPDPQKTLPFRYQMTGFHGLPVEGRWYTNTFRNTLIAQVDSKSGYVSRDIQDLRQTMSWEGGNPVERQQGYVMRYAGVAVQYFASVIVVDNQQEKQDFLAHARPTLETAVVKGVIGKVDLTHNSFELVRSDNNKTETFRIREDEKASLIGQGLHKDLRTAVVYTTGGYDGAYPEYAHKLLDEAQTQPLWEDDVGVRVATEPIELKPGGEAVHKYLLYNGPVKTMLLSQMGGVEAVRPELVNRYLYDLNLDTLTDYQSNNWFGNYITGPLRISYLLIQITNVMHTVLWGLHYYVGLPYIVCIMCLTLMVRGVMFPVSRKQAMTSLRMQELAPELKKLKEKFGDDKAAMGAAQMELYRKHGINPLGTCWMLLLQMPIFMGLYYSLQESIHFRLAGVSSYWMPNLAAPDMLVYWTNHIPFISQPESYGWPWYLGPFLNVLPILAVSLMLVQQKWTMPPPTDEQQEQQQKMMKYMMIFMGLMFYKVASGLCIYFIASSLWGFMERRMLPKRKPGAPPTEGKPGVLARLLPPKSPNGTAVTTAPKETFSSRFLQEESRAKGKRGKRRQDKTSKVDGDGSMWQRLLAWCEEMRKQAEKK